MSVDLLVILVPVILLLLITAWKKFAAATEESNTRRRADPRLLELVKESEVLQKELCAIQLNRVLSEIFKSNTREKTGNGQEENALRILASASILVDIVNIYKTTPSEKVKELAFNKMLPIYCEAKTFRDFKSIHDCIPSEDVLAKMLQLASTFNEAQLVHSRVEDGSEIKRLAWAKMQRLI